MDAAPGPPLWRLSLVTRTQCIMSLGNSQQGGASDVSKKFLAVVLGRDGHGDAVPLQGVDVVIEALQV